MKSKRSRIRFTARLAVLGAIYFASGVASAGGDAEVVYGYGVDDYRSYEVNGGFDLPGLPLGVNLAHGVARQNGTEVSSQITAGLAWTPNDWLMANYDHRILNTALFDVDVQGYGIGVNLDPLWDGELKTRVDLGYEESVYDANARPAVRAALNPLLPRQHRRSIGISQDVTRDITISLARDEYVYTKDPVNLATMIVQRLRRINSGVFELIGMPDRARSAALNWRTNDKLSFDLSQDISRTVLDQKRTDTRFGVAYSPADSVRLGAAMTRSTATAIVGPMGNTILNASADDYYELSLRYTFD